jgi:hypothetical protein
VPEAEKIMHPRWPVLRNAVLFAAVGIALCGCDSALEPLVGKSKEAAARSKPQDPPPAPPPTAAFMTDDDLVPGYAGRAILPPPLEAPDIGDSSDDAPDAPTAPHHAIVAVPLSADSTALAMLSAGAKREAAPAGTHFVLLVLSPPAADAAALDKTNTAARNAASAAVKILGDSGIPADQIEVSMATSPNAGDGELRLYRR